MPFRSTSAGAREMNEADRLAGWLGLVCRPTWLQTVFPPVKRLVSLELQKLLATKSRLPSCPSVEPLLAPLQLVTNDSKSAVLTFVELRHREICKHTRNDTVL